jgi:PAS domain S-box-containing protein
MKKLDLKKPLGLLALLLLAWLFKQSTQIDVDLHIRTVQHFERLREHDAKLNQYVLQARYWILRNYDPLVSTQQEMSRILVNLRQDKPDAFADGDSPIQAAFSAYQQSLVERWSLIESFKSHNAVLGNSLRYFPLAAKAEGAASKTDPEVRELLHDLLDHVLLFDQDASSLNRDHLQATARALRRTAIGNTPSVNSLLQHVDVILGHRTEVDELAHKITYSESGLQADRLLALYNEDFARRDHSAGHYKLAMALLAAAMMLYVGWLLTHLQRARDTLAASLRELEFQKNALDMHSIVSVTDRTGKILYTNSKFSEVSQYSAEELRGQDHRLLNSGHHPSEFFKTMWATIGTGNIWQGEVLNRRKDGSLYWVDSTVAPFMDDNGRPLRYVSIRTDITARKQSEAVLLKAKEDADSARRVAEQAQHAAENANRIKGDFLANMSHEIRTPMNGIIGMTTLALSTDLTADQREFLTLIKSSSDSLLQVINDILDFSKIESGKLDLENIAFSLESMLRDTMKTLALRAHQKNLELLLNVAPDVPDRIHGDPGRLRQVLINLIGNAVKFTERGEIEVSVERTGGAANGSARVRFSVRDTGIGIPAEKFGTIFESFSQADTSTTRKFGGTGLGLTISSQIVQLMGGQIALRSEVGKGSTFHFTVDFPVVADLALSHYQQTGKVTGMRVLVVDDNATNRRVLEEMLNNWKMLPHSVASGEEALLEIQRAAIEGQPYALAILDGQMPHMDGFELAEQLRNGAQQPPFTVMMLTSQGERGDAARCKELGISSYLSKPVSQSDLMDAIMTALGEPSNLQVDLITQHSLRESRRKLSLLLAEDNSVNQILAIRLLEKLGHSVTLAHNGREAVEHWRCGSFDAILMDVDMPEMNGYEATQLIRQEEEALGTRIPIVAMTAHAMKGSREECIEHGMDGYVSKPIDVELLWRELDGIVQGVAATPIATTIPMPSSLAIADFKQAREIMDNNRELFEEITGQYLRDAPLLLMKIKTGLAQDDAPAIRSAAHTLQGMASVFAAERTVAAARATELNADHADRTLVVDELEATMVELENEIASYQW